jgi:hypothetical protein
MVYQDAGFARTRANKSSTLGKMRVTMVATPAAVG